VDEPSSPLRQLRAELLSGQNTVVDVARRAMARANGNVSNNTYIWIDPGRVAERAVNVAKLFSDQDRRPRLYGVPVSLKDCFDLAGAPTSCGTRFYAEKNGIAMRNSAVADALLAAGAVIVGKTHLHPLAYGITGENPEYGDCLQPQDATRLTGGSSSGAAASVQEGSAIAAIGTDTGGSIRVPAAMCGLAGYRSSIELGKWQGGAHLAPSFDTIGWLYSDLADGPHLAAAFPGVSIVEYSPRNVRIAVPSLEFLYDCDTDVLDSMARYLSELENLGATIERVSVNDWSESTTIFTSIQAHEAAQLHAGNFEQTQPDIRERLVWGSSLTRDVVQELHNQHATFRARMDALLGDFDYLLLPAAPVSSLPAGADHSETRRRLLRYTAPVSLAGMPVVTLPMKAGGMQLVSARGSDGELLAFSAWLGSHRSLTQ
jgi:Asp-tRNA(Asn)/Glu-tRNA(Gln) amidotransferase A subunit family amidase